MSTEDEHGRKRLSRIKKACRKYLTHLQKSVFEGEITDGTFAKLQNELQSTIDKDNDFVVIYALPDGNKLKRTILTNTVDPLDNLL